MLYDDYTKESHLSTYHSAFEALEMLVERLFLMVGEDVTLGDAEALIKNEGSGILRRAAQGFLDQRSREEEMRTSIVGEDGQERTQHRRCTRQIESQFGSLSFSRIGYLGRGLSITYPLDAVLNLPISKYSHGLQGEVAHLVAVESFDETRESLERQEGDEYPSGNCKRWRRAWWLILIHSISGRYPCHPSRNASS